MASYGLYIGEFLSIFQLCIATWLLISLIVGSQIPKSWIIIPKYKVSLKTAIARISIFVFLSAICFGVGSIGAVTVQEDDSNAILKCDLLIRFSVFFFVLTAGCTYIFLIVKLQATKIE
jgi:hypothetical protein